MIAEVLLITFLTNFIYCVPIHYGPTASYYATAVPTKFIASAPAPIIHAAPTQFIHAAPTARIIHSESSPIYHSAAPAQIYHSAAAPAQIYHSAPTARIIHTAAPPAQIYHSTAPARIIHTATAPIYHSAPAQIYHSAAPARIIHTATAPIYQRLITPAKIVKEIEAEETFDSNPEYSFSYGVNDPHTGDNKHAEESLHNGVVRGSYTLAEPDGTIRKVTYTADKDNGFNAVVEKSGSEKIIAAAPAKIITTAPAPPPPPPPQPPVTYAKFVTPAVYDTAPIISHGYHH